MRNNAISNRLLSSAEAEAIRLEYHTSPIASYPSLCRRLTLKRRTLRDIINRTGAYTPENDADHDLYLANEYPIPRHLEARRAEVVPNIVWPDQLETVSRVTIADTVGV